MRLSRILLMGSCALLVGCGDMALLSGDGMATLHPSPTVFSIHGTVLENGDVSTVTRGDGRLGIMASDEGAVVQVLDFSDNGLSARIRESHALAEPEDLEIDFEASTFSNGWYFVTGSHGVAKKKGVYQESRTRLYRFRLDSEAGISDLEGATLSELFANDPTLADYHQKPLQQKGLNVEGLAAREGDLYVGLRNPNLEGDAVVVRVGAESLFTDAEPAYDVLRVPLGSGLGIRGMTNFGEGFLMIAGNAGSETSKDQPVTEDYVEGRPSELVFWNPESGEVIKHGALPRKGKGKEEGLFVLAGDGSDSSVEVVIVYDSIPDGGATAFKIY